MAKARGIDFFDPSIQQAQFAGKRVASLTAKDVLGNGGQLLARFEFSMNDTAQLAALQRIVRAESLGKVFGDGEIFNEIAETRTADVSFFRLADDTGISIATIAGGTGAMLALLSKADMSDLDMSPPKYSPEKLPAPDAPAPQIAKLIVDGAEIAVKLKAGKERKAEKVERDEFPTSRAANPIGVNMMGNPIAAKAFLAEAFTADSQAAPSHRVDDMIFASFLATSSHIHHQDAQWPTGITVVDKIANAPIESPAKAFAIFNAAVIGQAGPVINRDELADQFRAHKAKAAGPR